MRCVCLGVCVVYSMCASDMYMCAWYIVWFLCMVHGMQCVRVQFVCCMAYSVMCAVCAVNVHVVYGVYMRYGLCVYMFVCHMYVWGSCGV